MPGTIDNQNATIHGACGAERRLTTGEGFIGVAHEIELEVADELNNDGLIAVYRKRTTRLQAVADLYYAAILGATDIEKLDKWVQRYGWLQASALRSMVVLRDLEKSSRGESLNELLGKVKDAD
jgi:hypothetical protein